MERMDNFLICFVCLFYLFIFEKCWGDERGVFFEKKKEGMKIEKEFIRKPVAHNTIKCHIGTPSSLFFVFFFFIIFLNSSGLVKVFPFQNKEIYFIESRKRSFKRREMCMYVYDCHLLNNYTISLCVCVCV